MLLDRTWKKLCLFLVFLAVIFVLLLVINLIWGASCTGANSTSLDIVEILVICGVSSLIISIVGIAHVIHWDEERFARKLGFSSYDAFLMWEEDSEK